MGWCGGSSIFSAVIKAAKRFIKDPKDRRKFYLALLPEFNAHDWDTQNECDGLDSVFDKILREQYPEFFEDDDQLDDE